LPDFVVQDDDDDKNDHFVDIGEDIGVIGDDESDKK
jgi:hypothetical protein